MSTIPPSLPPSGPASSPAPAAGMTAAAGPGATPSAAAGATGALSAPGQSFPVAKSSAVPADPVAPSPAKGITTTVVSSQTGPMGPAAGPALPTGTVFTVRIVDVRNASTARPAPDAAAADRPAPSPGGAGPTDAAFTSARLARQAYGQSLPPNTTPPAAASPATAAVTAGNGAAPPQPETAAPLPETPPSSTPAQAAPPGPPTSGSLDPSAEAAAPASGSADPSPSPQNPSPSAPTTPSQAAPPPAGPAVVLPADQPLSVASPPFASPPAAGPLPTATPSLPATVPLPAENGVPAATKGDGTGAAPSPAPPGQAANFSAPPVGGAADVRPPGQTYGQPEPEDAASPAAPPPSPAPVGDLAAALRAPVAEAAGAPPSTPQGPSPANPPQAAVAMAASVAATAEESFPDTVPPPAAGPAAADIGGDSSGIDSPDPLAYGATAEDPAPAITGLPPSLTGIVAANTHAGLPLLQTSLGLLSLETAVDLPAGALVTLQPLDDPTLPMPDDGAGPAAPPPGAGFAEAIDVLRQAGSQAVLPNPAAMRDLTVRLAATLIGLTAAVDSANVRPWLGDRLVKTLAKTDRPDLVARMEKDLAGLKTPVRMPLDGTWQCLILPLPLGQQIEPIRLVVRRPPGDEAEAEAREEEGTRFLIDVTLSRLGAIQIDGLLRRKTRRFDMILRSHAVLPGKIRHDIEAIFARSLEGLDMAGGASFQQTLTFIEPIPAAAAEMSGWVI